MAGLAARPQPAGLPLPETRHGYGASVVWDRRGRQVSVELDLGVFGDVGIDEDDGPRPGEPHDHEPAGAASATARVRRGRAAIAASVVVFLALSAWGATTEIDARRRLASLLSAPGGVLSLARPVSAASTVEAEATHLPVFMPGLVVIQRGSELHGVDIGTGTQRWQVEVGISPTCGPPQMGRTGAVTADPLVCFATEPDGRQTVTVIRTNGASVTRQIDQNGATAAAATADGNLVTVRRTGPTPPPADAHVTAVAGGGYVVQGSVAAGQDAVVRLEDAETGAPRWERTLTFTPVADASNCAVIAVDADNQATLDVTRLTVSTPSSLVDVQGCGIQGLFTATGGRVDLAFPQTSVTSWLEPYADGGALRHDYPADGSEPQTLIQPDGTTTRFADQVLSPLATDGTHPDVVLLGTIDQWFQARDRSGSVRWHNSLPVTQVLARTSRVAVVTLGGGLAVAGIDMKTGKTLWIDPTSFLDSTATTRDRTSTAMDLGSSTSMSALAAFTDGYLVTMAMADPNATTRRLITLDLATGDVRWRAATPSSANDWTQYYTAAGHLISLSVVMPAPGTTSTSATVTAWH